MRLPMRLPMRLLRLSPGWRAPATKSRLVLPPTRSARAGSPAATGCRQGLDWSPNPPPKIQPESDRNTVEEAIAAVAESSKGASSAGQSAGSQSADDPLAEFGANEWLVDEMYEQYQRDPNSVDKVWWDFFKNNAPGGNGSNGAPNEATKRSGRGSGSGSTNGQGSGVKASSASQGPAKAPDRPKPSADQPPAEQASAPEGSAPQGSATTPAQPKVT